MTRRATWPPYTEEEAAQVRNAVVTPQAPVLCPRCGQDLDMLGPVGGGAVVWQFRCEACRRSVVVYDPPKERTSGEW